MSFNKFANQVRVRVPLPSQGEPTPTLAPTTKIK